MALGLAIAFVVGCASTPPLDRPASLPHGASPQTVRSTVVDTTREMLGTRYRCGGGSPEEGFDCSGLVVYSYQRAGVHGLPRSARDLERQDTPISMDALQPGDNAMVRDQAEWKTMTA
jgi:cell wall-associated NlpC family hydrolase